MISCRNITKIYGGVKAVDNVSIYADEQETVGIIGSNGAGKTTLFNILTGYDTATDGDIFINKSGKEYKINALKPHERIKKGIGRTFQNVRLFPDMTVYENILAGKLGTNYKKSDIENILQEIELTNERDILAKSLPYGKRKIAELARCLASGANILLLDEPAAGLNEQEAYMLTDIIIRLKRKYKLTIILIEHNMSFIQNLCTRIYAMDLGKLICEGNTRDVLNNQLVIDAVFGGNTYAIS